MSTLHAINLDYTLDAIEIKPIHGQTAIDKIFPPTLVSDKEIASESYAHV